MALMEPPLWNGWRSRFFPRRDESVRDRALPERAKEEKLAAPVAQLKRDVLDEVAKLPAVAELDELPANWLAQLSNDGVVAQSFVEAVAHALRLEVNRYREQLVAFECRIRVCADDRDLGAIAELIDQLRYVNQDWLDKQTAAADMLNQRSGRLGDHEQAAATLEQSLLDQAALIRAACGTLESLDATSEAENRAKQLVELVSSLLTHAHG